MEYEELLKKIQSLQSKITIIGLGQVGLPVALTLSGENFKVTGYDINDKLMDSIAEGHLPFEETNLEKMLNSCIKNNTFFLSKNFQETINNSDIIIICVPTPISDSNMPDLSAFEKVCKSITAFELNNKLIIIESSIPPGTFENIFLPYFEKKYSIGQNLFLAYIPERLSPDQAFEEIKNTSRIVGSVDTNSSILAVTLYEKIVKNEIFSSNVKIAEISKLVENTYRDVNVAFANEVGLICEKYGVDASELIKISNTHPRVNILTPGPGVGGPCLPKDPFLLLNPINNSPIKSGIITESRKINDYMPIHVVKSILDSIEKKQKTIQNLKILIMGVAYKANISDTRNSPSKPIISNLLEKGADLYVFDPKTKENFNANTISDFSASNGFDVIVFVTDHKEFKQMKLSEIYSHMNKNNPILVDTRRIFDNKEAEKLGFHYVSVGYISE